MNTHGHEWVATKGGLPLLEKAFKDAGKPVPRLSAFYFGNWLTDVSQLVDPVATAGFMGKIKELFNKAADLAHGTTLYKTPAGFEPLAKFLPAFEMIIKHERDLINGAIDKYILAGNETRSSDASKLIRTAFRFAGYFKFSHPKYPGAKPGMDPDLFFKLFDEIYTQYYPHEHLDRPEVLPAQNPSKYEKDSEAKINPVTGEEISPHLYKYLREDIILAAGLLSEVEHDWACKTFQPGYQVDDTNFEWNLSLAKLGHALHAVEDFFAHSNFIEHAALLMGEEFIPKEYQYDHHLFLKRLKCWQPEELPDWNDYEKEHNVVTGYFDGTDTAISMLHLLEGLTGFDVEDPTRLLRFADDVRKEPKKIIDSAWEYMQDRIKDAVEFYEDPKKAVENSDNEFAKKYQESFGKDIGKILRPTVDSKEIDHIFKELKYYNDIPSWVRADIFNLILLLSKKSSIINVLVSAFRSLKSIIFFVASPVDWVQSLLKDKLKDEIKNIAVFWTKESFYTMIGRDRIGCHSLMAKDHGAEWLYDPMRNCATSVHWYVVNTMCRWANPKENKNFVDWLELLEYFLKHPRLNTNFKYKKIDFATTKIHIVKDGDSLESLGKDYKESSVDPKNFSWELIADVNFDIAHILKIEPGKKTKDGAREKIVNQILKDNKWGYPVRMKPNYAFNPGLPIIIPNQKISIEVAEPISEGKKWYAYIMENSWETIQGYEDAEQKKSVAIHSHVPVSIKTLQIEAFIDKSIELRSKLEKSYR